MLRMLPLVALVLVLTACGGVGERMRAPDPVPTAPFASEEEALAAAVAVYARFSVIGDEIGHNGGQNADRLGEVLAGEFLDQSITGLSSWIEKGWHQVGYSRFRDPVLQQFSAGPTDAVILYLCDDITEVDVVDQTGTSVAVKGRPDTNYFQVSFDLGADNQLRISGRLRWDERTC